MFYFPNKIRKISICLNYKREGISLSCISVLNNPHPLAPSRGSPSTLLRRTSPGLSQSGGTPTTLGANSALIKIHFQYVHRLYFYR